MLQTRQAFVRSLLGLMLLFAGTTLAGRSVVGQSCDSTQVLDDEAAGQILASQRPFEPMNRDLFISYVNPAWVDAAPPIYADGPALTVQETRESLRDFLQLRFSCSPQRVLDGLAVFDNPLLEQKVADPTLRAALAALTGTLGEPAINFILFQAPISAIYFGVVIHYGNGFPTGISATAYALPDGTWHIVIDSRFRYNSFASFSALLFHESLHVESPPAADETGVAPDGVGLPEETTAVALESIVYMQMLLTDPSLARLPDLLTRGANNHLALVRLNSGEAGTDRLNIFLPDSRQNIDPLFVEPLTEFYTYYSANDGYDGDDEVTWSTLETHGNPLLQAVLPALAEPGETPPEQPDYDSETLQFLDQNQAILSPGELVAVACILELDVPCDG